MRLLRLIAWSSPYTAHQKLFIYPQLRDKVNRRNNQKTPGEVQAGCAARDHGSAKDTALREAEKLQAARQERLGWELH